MVKEIYLIHHSHTDLGYTNYQSTVMANQRDYLRQAMRLAERYADGQPGEQFKWTVEVLLTLEDFVQHATSLEIDQLKGLHQRGLIDFSSLWGNWFPLADVQILTETFGIADRLRKTYGFDMRYGLNCDVTGQPWGLVELMLDSGMQGLAMAMNRTMARDPQPRPRGFWWQGPSGRSLLTWHGEHYGLGQHFGIPRVKTSAGWVVDMERSRVKLSGYLENLEKNGYPYDFALFQITSTFMFDNGGPHEDLVRFVRDWNARGWQPRLRLANLGDFFTRLEAEPNLPTQNGDWTDWWTQGVASNIFETVLSRQNHARLLAARTLGGLLANTTKSYTHDAMDDEQAWRNLATFDEHTWGSDESVTHPSSPNTRGTLYRKYVHVYDAHAAVTRLIQNGLANLAAHLPQSETPQAVIFNPLPWKRTVPLYMPRLSSTSWALPNLVRYTELASPFSSTTLGVDYGMVELPAGGYITLPLRLSGPVNPNPNFSLEGMAHIKEPDLVPNIAPGLAPSQKVTSNGWTLQNRFYRLQVNPATGAIDSLITLQDGKEWVDQTTPWRLGQYIYETNRSARGRSDMQMTMESLPDFDRQPYLSPRREGIESIQSCRFIPGVGKCRLELKFIAPGASQVCVQFILYEEQPWIDLIFDIEKTPIPEPESVYIAFPLALKDPQAHYDTTGAIVQAEQEQLPYACRDFFYVQSWVDVSDQQRGLTLIMPDAPMVHIGGFTNHKYLKHLQLDQPLLLSWVMNNHWCTAYPTMQQGWTRFTYRLLPHSNPYDPSTASRLAAETTCQPLIGPVTDHPAGWLERFYDFEPDLPESASFLSLEANSVQLVGVQVIDEGLILHLQETAGQSTVFQISFPNSPVTSAATIDLTGTFLEELKVSAGSIHGQIEARRLQCVRVAFEPHNETE